MTPTPEQNAKRETPRTDATWNIAKVGPLNGSRNWRSIAFDMRDFARTLETELQQLRLAADGMRDALVDVAKKKNNRRCWG